MVHKMNRVPYITFDPRSNFLYCRRRSYPDYGYIQERVWQWSWRFRRPADGALVPPAQAAAIVLPLLCIIDIFNVWHYRSRFDRRNLTILILAAIFGILIGTFTFRYLTDAHIRIIIGVISVAFVVNYLIGKRNEKKQTEPNVVSGELWGAVAGFTSFGVHAVDRRSTCICSPKN